MLGLLWRTLFRWQLIPHYVTGRTYGPLEKVVAAEKAGISAYTALPNSAKRPSFSPRMTSSTTPKEAVN
jgi:hypothetical protein